MDEILIDLAPRIEIVYGPLVDAQEFPKNVDVTLVEGAVGNQEDLEKIHTIRQSSKIVIALGDCAATGNIPSMRNTIPVRQVLERVYQQNVDAGDGGIPTEGVPTLLRHAIPIHRVVKVDYCLPGCPPPADLILSVLGALLDGKTPELGTAAKFG
jgi:NAD-reducing hydrogenase small subunit